LKNKYEIRGKETVIYLNRKNGDVLETIIDTTDLPIADAFPYTWYAHYNPYNKSFYVVGNDRSDGVTNKRVFLHRKIMETPEGMVTDHKEHDTLDNRRASLRNVDYSTNNHNLKNGRKDNKSSGYPGVTLDSWHKKKGRKIWRARISLDGKRRQLGLYENKEDAIEAVRKAREEHLRRKLEG